MDQEIKDLLEAQSRRIEEIYTSVEKTRKYFLATLIISLVLFVLPLIGLLFAIPAALESISSGYDLDSLEL